MKKLGYNTDWYKFAEKNNNCILLCVNRFREGSDIKNLDIVIYLDSVKNRSLLVSLQTSGRVLRKDKFGKKTHGIIIDSFVNCNGIQIEVMTAEKIINYYKQIFVLCDNNEYEEQKETYNKMINICKKMKYDEALQEIEVKIDDNKKHNMKFKLKLKTKTYDFANLKIHLETYIDKMYNVDKRIKFDQIIEKLKDGKYMNINTRDFWDAYDRIDDDEKEEMNIPMTSKDLYRKNKDFFDTESWYDILNLDIVDGMIHLINAGMPYVN